MNASLIRTDCSGDTALNTNLTIAERTRSSWIAWLPLVVLPTAAAVFTTGAIPPWQVMWLVSTAIYFSFKWLSWRSMHRPDASIARKLAWWLAWPGMNVTRFLSPEPLPESQRPERREWIGAIGMTFTGIALLYLGRRLIADGAGFAGGWVGMFGILLILHFGSFHLMSCGWRAAGIDAPPIMDRPLTSQTLAVFWGRRWNRAFRDTAFTALFKPIARRFGAMVAMWSVFLLSGVIHELGISAPARAGIGLPTLYFVLQATALSAQGLPSSRRYGCDRGRTGQVLTLLVVFGPIAILFHRQFVTQVVVPFMQVLTPS